MIKESPENVADVVPTAHWLFWSTAVDPIDFVSLYQQRLAQQAPPPPPATA